MTSFPPRICGLLRLAVVVLGRLPSRFDAETLTATAPAGAGRLTLWCAGVLLLPDMSSSLRCGIGTSACADHLDRRQPWLADSTRDEEAAHLRRRTSFPRSLTRALRAATATGSNEGGAEALKLAQGSSSMNLPSSSNGRATSGCCFERTGRSLYPYSRINSHRLGRCEHQDVLHTLSNGLPPDTGKPRHSIGIDNGEECCRRR